MIVARRDFGLDEIAEAFTTNEIDVGKLMSNNCLLLVDNKEWYLPDEIEISIELLVSGRIW